MAWLNISLDLPEREAASCLELFDNFGALSVSSTDAADSPVLEPLPGTNPLWDLVRICALFELHANLDGLTRLLTKELGRKVQLDVQFLESTDWSQTWRQYASSYRFDNSLWVVPTDWQMSEEQNQGFDGVLLRLDPGLAFGTGNHATTYMCLDWLSRAQLQNATLIDYGCGSGILALAAILLGAGKVYAVDYDEQALTATENNARLNHVESQQIVVTGVDGLQKFEVDAVVANILMNPLLELSEKLVAFVKPGGYLVLSGILEDQVSQIRNAYPLVHFEPPVVKDGWACLFGKKVND